MPRRDDRLLLEDMHECIVLIESYVVGLDSSSFCADRKTLDAVVRNLEVLGEAANALSQDIRDAFPCIDWRGVIGLRNRLNHEYFDVDPSIVWMIVNSDLPILKAQLLEFIC